MRPARVAASTAALEAKDFGEANVNKLTNDLWDLQLAGWIGAELDGGILHVVADDRQIEKAAKAAGKEQFVLKLDAWRAMLSAD